MRKNVKAYAVKSNNMCNKRKQGKSSTYINRRSDYHFNADLIGISKEYVFEDCFDYEISEVGIDKEYHLINQLEHLYDRDNL